MPATEIQLDCTLSVHEIITRHPAARAVFNRFGLDTCCGAAASVQESAVREGVDPVVLCAALHDAVRAA